MEHRINKTFKLITLLVVTLLLVPEIFKHGLFMDGLFYSTLGHNLAHGIGTFWHPSFSAGVMAEFYEHPPLAFGIQAIFFKLFGSGFWVEKLYSFLTAIITGVLIIVLWKRQQPDHLKEYFWFPVLLWMTVQPVIWSYNNNMLENTLGVFSLGAVYLMFINIDAKLWRQVFISLLAAILMILSFLSKGFPGLFPLGFYFCYYLAYSHRVSFGWMIRKSLLLVGVFILLGTALFMLNPDALDALLAYLEAQLFPALQGVNMQKPWYHIMKALTLQTSGMLALTVILILTYYGIRVRPLFESSERRSIFTLWFLIGLSATAPMMISAKQLTFYIVPSIPYFAMAFAGLTVHILHDYFKRLKLGLLFHRILNVLLVIAVLGIVGRSIGDFEESGRDKELLADVRRIGSALPEGSLVSIDKSLSKNWSLMGYLQRYYFIGLDRSGEMQAYHLVKKTDTIPGNYEPINIEMEHFILSRNTEEESKNHESSKH